jgi:RNA-binding protein PNO1
MVVVQSLSAASPSSPPKKKNRRTISRKPAPNVAPPKSSVINVEADDGDQDMERGDITDVLDGVVAPTASRPSASSQNDSVDDDDEMLIDDQPSDLPNPSSAPVFAPAPASVTRSTLKSEMRRIAIPPHRMTPLKNDWINIFGPLTEMLGLQVRMNVQRKCVEARTSKHTKDIGALQKGADFVRAYALGFDVNVCLVYFRLRYHPKPNLINRIGRNSSPPSGRPLPRLF